jgi:head-tail adaptor
MSRPVLNRRLVLEAPVSAPDGMGGTVPGWAVLGVIWGDIRPRSGRERTEDGVPLAQVPVRVTVRASAPGSEARPQAGQRFREGDRIFRILAVSEDAPRGRHLICDATEEVAV